MPAAQAIKVFSQSNILNKFGTKNKINQHHQNYVEKNFPGENNNNNQIIPISDATYTSLNELASKKVPPVLDKNYSFKIPTIINVAPQYTETLMAKQYICKPQKFEEK